MTTLRTPANDKQFVPQLIIINANIHTMDAANPSAQAIAISANRIIAVGRSLDIMRLAGPQTRVIDAHSQLVLPGFNDSHVHFLTGGFQLSSVDLRDANSPEEFADRLRRFAQKSAAGRWITGGDWDHERWTG